MYVRERALLTLAVMVGVLAVGCGVGEVDDPWVQGDTIGDDIDTLSPLTADDVEGDFPEEAEAAETSSLLQVAGKKTFPIGLSNRDLFGSGGPALGEKTPWGADGLSEVIGAGIGVLKVGPSTPSWTDADLATVKNYLWAVHDRGATGWVSLRALGSAQPNTAADTRLRTVVNTLKGNPGLGMWKGADEPLYWYKYVDPQHPQPLFSAPSIRHASAVTKTLDPAHAYAVIQAPRGTPTELAAYSPGLDLHGVDIYPIGLGMTDPDLHRVGAWTKEIASVTPHNAVVMALQICSSGSHDDAGHYVLPSRRQERFMIYDAIVNHAKGLFFFGGRDPDCMSAADARLGFNWTFWQNALKPLVKEIGPHSPFYPALLNPGSGLGLHSSRRTVQVMSRQSGTRDIWVVATYRGFGPRDVTISGLPSGITKGWVYVENRGVVVKNGAFTDHFAERWGVHVYHFVRP